LTNQIVYIIILKYSLKRICQNDLLISLGGAGLEPKTAITSQAQLV